MSNKVNNKKETSKSINEKKLMLFTLILLAVVCLGTALIVFLSNSKQAEERISEYRDLITGSNIISLCTDSQYCDCFKNQKDEQVYIYKDSENTFEMTVYDKEGKITVIISDGGENVDVLWFETFEEYCLDNPNNSILIRNNIENMLNNYTKFSIVEKESSIFNDLDITEIGYNKQSGIEITDGTVRVGLGEQIMVYADDNVCTAVEVCKTSDWELPAEWYEYSQEEEIFVRNMDDIIDILNNTERRD